MNEKVIKYRIAFTLLDFGKRMLQIDDNQVKQEKG